MSGSQRGNNSKMDISRGKLNFKLWLPPSYSEHLVSRDQQTWKKCIKSSSGGDKADVSQQGSEDMSGTWVILWGTSDILLTSCEGKRTSTAAWEKHAVEELRPFRDELDHALVIHLDKAEVQRVSEPWN